MQFYYFKYKYLFHQFLKNFNKLGNYLVVAIAYITHHAVADMVCNEVLIEGIDCSVYRGGLN